MTTLPEGGRVRARVLAVPDIDAGDEHTEYVDTLLELHRVLDAWWTTYWTR